MTDYFISVLAAQMMSFAFTGSKLELLKPYSKYLKTFRNNFGEVLKHSRSGQFSPNELYDNFLSKVRTVYPYDFYTGTVDNNGATTLELITNHYKKTDNVDADSPVSNLPQFTKNHNLMILNHIGGLDFFVAIELVKLMGDLSNIKFITLSAFKLPPAGKIFKALDVIFLTQKPELDGPIIEKYMEAHKEEKITFVLFPEGCFLSKSNYKISAGKHVKMAFKIPNFQRDSDQHGFMYPVLYENLNFPAGQVAYSIINAFIADKKEFDVFDVTLKYFKDMSSGSAINGDFMGDKYGLENVLFKKQHPDAIAASVRVIHGNKIHVATRSGFNSYLNSIWNEKSFIWNKMTLKYLDADTVDTADSIDATTIRKWFLFGKQLACRDKALKCTLTDKETTDLKVFIKEERHLERNAKKKKSKCPTCF